MFTGTGNGTEKFSLYVPASSDHVTLQTEANADMFINTGGNINRIVIKDGGVGSASGNVAIGNNLPANFNPDARLHLHHDDNSQVNLRFTHAGTGPTASDGSRLVLNPQADFFMINHEADRDLYFLTSGGGNPQTRLRILGNGLVEVGTPGSPSEIPSQMRFVNMSSNNTPNPNPGQGVLSVDDAGNVIYVQGGGGSSLGNLCTATQNPLTGNYQIPLNGNNFAFNGNGRVGVGTNCTPARKFEVMETTNAPQLRIAYDTQQYTDFRTRPSGNLNILPVSSTSTNGSSSFGNTCGETQNPLTADYEVPLGGNDFYFTGGGLENRNRVRIGVDCNSQIYRNSKFLSYQNYLREASTGWHYAYAGIFANRVQSNVAFTSVCGIAGEARGTFNQAASNTVNVAGLFVSGTAAKSNYGIQAIVRAGAEGNSPQSIRYAVFAQAGSPNLNYVRAGYFDGRVEATSFGLISSDEIFKKEVRTERGALGIISKLNPVSYEMNIEEYPQFSFSEGKQHGFIAQEVEQVLPELIFNSYHPGETDSLGNVVVEPMEYKSMNYTSIIPLNTQAIKELNAKVDKRTLSDGNIKKNIHGIDNALNKLMQMRGVEYEWDNENNPDLGLDTIKHIGFVAQEINEIDEKLTFIDEENFMHVDYEKVVPVVVESIHDLHKMIVDKDSIIDDLNSRLMRLEDCLSNILQGLCQMNHRNTRATTPQEQEQLQRELEIILSDNASIVLSQNVPNPFAESTVIEYSIPESVGQVQVLFYDNLGTLINSIDITERGKGSLKVFANDLSSGIYSYTLIADGKVVASKKMMKQ
jgi:hypothetical protein